MTQQRFQKRCEVEVPARSPVGPSPSREATFSFKVLAGFHVLRGAENFGASVAQVNFGGLTERRREFQSIDNGVELTWKLSNGEVFPVTGRTAFMDIELVGESTEQMALSAKYLAFRHRFLNEFFFDGIIAEYIDGSLSGGKVKFADQTIYLGLALLVFSTEAAILRATGGDVSDCENRISTLLEAINRLDRAAEPYFGAAVALDGFFLRDDVAGPGDPRLGGRFAECESDFQNPQNENASPSGDQIFGLMFGLSAVVRLSGSASLSAQAKEISARLFEYARRNRFVLTLPNGSATRRGSDMRWLSSLLNGLNKDITGDDRFSESEIDLLGQRLPLTGVAAFWDDPVSARQIADLAGGEFRVPLIGTDVELNSFALHLMLMAIAPSDVWNQSEVESVAMKVQHHLSVLIHCLRHPGRLPAAFDRSAITAILNACPDTGPAASLPPVSGWNKDNRWIRSGNLGEPSNAGSQRYNGLDWLILHDLDQLVFVGS